MSRELLETFPNPRPGREYTIEHVAPEFTSLCPKTGQPDFATITLTYAPAELCVELKSLKMYYHSFRNKGIFYEAVVNEMLDDFVAAFDPLWIEVRGEFHVRGGISSVVVAQSSRAEEPPNR
ncbi:NADPH-dependent 7-cyano-7-deazaguanine reductase QueF [Fimbriimonadia bacterium ATM]|nr:MAG: NADPH-dependent 7-cyano-7-deazaguanine reductase QueF [Armatimonadota bacterium]MBC6968438.1 NADPH-dependent 7-cyano-7-deazaguanine reductase QueF [Armatimonadota bacterium]MCE7898724.1 NADPH-dependent 7-cyano-7-deazaguanine reductase QueF [Armatimonadetes bacterium ATM1]MDL1928779.1 NADPH-dependent 7-cyano-7-deazaguanine reductase QueF [Fimbriimonadia bacterium ATM]RIJ98442.1 MAG: NADPH-dependent 7-cyano-7-deazaguanine reductase QueF [Armatimonadota bacterium]